MNTFDDILASVDKPGRYTGGEFGEIKKDPADVSTRFVFCFPDSYDIGMSYLGMKILYSLINSREDAYCERCFAPGLDMAEKLRENDLPLFSLETKTPLSKFDIIGFTLQYELSYTNILYMLELGGVPLRACDRDETHPLIFGGGPCSVNAEPIADFFDLFQIGDGEEVMMEVLDLYAEHKASGFNKKEFLKAASGIEGVYVPSLYKISYNEDGTVSAIENTEGAPKRIKRRIIPDLNSVYYPESFVVPFTEAVHDRAIIEIMRGCVRGCRFCQAGFIYRPLREKTAETNNRQAMNLCENTGYEELSLLSLSTSDYSELDGLISELLGWTEKEKTGLSLPSLRVDNFSEELRDKINRVKKSGLTFAPEAGTQRLRNVINKNVTEEEMLRTSLIAFNGGYNLIKLYFMIGLPTETEEDIEGIIKLAGDIVDLYYKNPNRQKHRSVTVSLGVACFVPKPFTPFQWESQDSMERLSEKQNYIRQLPRSKKINISITRPHTSVLEGALARGDRRLSSVILSAYKNGAVFDSWSEHFNFDIWQKAFEDNKLDISFYAGRKRSYDEVLPYDMIDCGISKDFLIREAEKAKRAETSPNCREKCLGCGIGCRDGKVGKL